MDFTFTVKVKAKRVEGRADAEEVAEEIRLHLEDDSNPESVYPVDAEYEITEWTVMQA